jgi:hypothetical protein
MAALHISQEGPPPTHLGRQFAGLCLSSTPGAAAALGAMSSFGTGRNPRSNLRQSPESTDPYAA